MAMRRIYEGQLAVADTDYIHAVEVDGDDVETEIDDLDVPVTDRPSLQLALDDPFETPFHGDVRGGGGITLRQIIDAIRAAYRGGMSGSAGGAIDDLVIESIDIDDEAGRLQVIVGG